MLWKDAFQPLGNAAIESRFADNRTYFYNGKEIDRQVHLGFDLAVTEHIPVIAANNGIVLFADYLGIYGNCVIIDHGLGVQSLYAHLSSIDVKPGDRVEKGRRSAAAAQQVWRGVTISISRCWSTAHPVNAVEWWDPKWMQDRVLRKVAEAGGV